MVLISELYHLSQRPI